MTKKFDLKHFFTRKKEMAFKNPFQIELPDRIFFGKESIL